MPRKLSRYLSSIQWETIDTPDEAIELWLIANADDPGQCLPTCVKLSVLLRCPQFRNPDLTKALSDMITAGLVMHTQHDGDDGPYESLVYTGGAWTHTEPTPTTPLPVTMQAPPEPTTPPQAYVVMHGNPATGFTIHGTWANANDAGDWADQNLAREYDYWVMPLTHAYP
jgi:hypothetical protein